MSQSCDPLSILAKTLIVSQNKVTAMAAVHGRSRFVTQPMRPVTADSPRMDDNQPRPVLSTHRRCKSSESDVQDEPLSIAALPISKEIEASADAVFLFHEYQLPTQEQLALAASLTVTSEHDLPVRFGSLWENQRAIVCFICHFWCPYCQDFISSLVQTAPSPQELAENNPPMSLIVISNGSHAMIRAYRRIFHFPFELFVDPTLSIYRALGMTLQTLDEDTDDVYDTLAMRVDNAACTRIPVREYGGHVNQLGGEFMLGPGLQCSYVHRMKDMCTHENAERLLAGAGVIFPGGNSVHKHWLTDEAKLGAREMKTVGAHMKFLKPKTNKLRPRNNKDKSRARIDQRCSQSDWAAALRASLIVFDRDHSSESLDPEGLVLSPYGGGFEFDPFDNDTLTVDEDDDDEQTCMACDSKDPSFGEQPVVLVAIRTKFNHGRGVIRDLSMLNSDKASP